MISHLYRVSQSEPSTTCVPSLIPPGMDAAHVDMRTFCPYTPNERKHRKRTTRPQLRVLEDVYKHDTKPNAALRKKLAAELGMTPRGVQVWFQNRRAKMKNLAKKLLAEKAGDDEQEGTHSNSESEPDADFEQRSSLSPSPVPQSASPLPDTERSSTLQAAAELAQSIPPATPSGSTSTLMPHHPIPDVYPNTRSESVPIPPPLSSLPPQAYPHAPMRTYSTDNDSGRHLTIPDAHLLALRRPSLPAYHTHSTPAFPQPRHPHSAQASLFVIPPYPSSSNPNLPSFPNSSSSPTYSLTHLQRPPGPNMARRCSVDTHTATHISRLASHPYAHVFAQRKAVLNPHLPRHHSLAGPEARTPGLGAQGLAMRTYAPVRDVRALLPGPLPAPDFSFGAPPPSEPAPTPAPAPQAPAMARSMSHPHLRQNAPYPPSVAVKQEEWPRVEDGEYDAAEGIPCPGVHPFVEMQQHGFNVPCLPPAIPLPVPVPRFGSLVSVGDSDESAGPLLSDGSAGAWSRGGSGSVASAEEIEARSRRGSDMGLEERKGSFSASASSVGGEADGRRGSIASTQILELFSDLAVNNPHSNPSSQAPSRRPSYAHLPHLSPSSTGFHSPSTVPGTPSRIGEGSSVPVQALRRQSSSLAYALHPTPPNNNSRRSSEAELYSTIAPTADAPQPVSMAEYTFPEVMSTSAKSNFAYGPYDIPPDADVPVNVQNIYPAVTATSASLNQSYVAPAYPPGDLASLYTFNFGTSALQEILTPEGRYGTQQHAPMQSGAMELQGMCVPADATLEALQYVGVGYTKMLQHP